MFEYDEHVSVFGPLDFDIIVEDIDNMPIITSDDLN